MKIVKTCSEERELGIGGAKGMEERDKYLNRNGWSRELVRRTHERGIKVDHDLIQRDRSVSK